MVYCGIQTAAYVCMYAMQNHVEVHAIHDIIQVGDRRRERIVASNVKSSPTESHTGPHEESRSSIVRGQNSLILWAALLQCSSE